MEVPRREPKTTMIIMGVLKDLERVEEEGVVDG